MTQHCNESSSSTSAPAAGYLLAVFATELLPANSLNVVCYVHYCRVLSWPLLTYSTTQAAVCFAAAAAADMQVAEGSAGASNVAAQQAPAAAAAAAGSQMGPLRGWHSKAIRKAAHAH
jgi:hypothetical protein